MKQIFYTIFFLIVLASHGTVYSLLKRAWQWLSFQIILTLFWNNKIILITGDSLYCYRCNSNHPGCGTPLNWLWYWGETCPEYDDKCV